ncbi:MAG TPA: Imm1 family immunity protein [Pseudonocardiaceae bacterium]
MTPWIVTGGHNGLAYPRVIANGRNQTAWLVDALLRESGPTETWFFVWDRPVGGDTGGHPRRWLRIGYDNGVGAALFHDGGAAPGDDFAWLTVGSSRAAAGPVYYDRDRPTIFPAGSVLPLGRLRDVILEWVRTGERPTSVEWLPVNSLTWDLTAAGELRR